MFSFIFFYIFSHCSIVWFSVPYRWFMMKSKPLLSSPGMWSMCDTNCEYKPCGKYMSASLMWRWRRKKSPLLYFQPALFVQQYRPHGAALSICNGLCLWFYTQAWPSEETSSTRCCVHTENWFHMHVATTPYVRLKLEVKWTKEDSTTLSGSVCLFFFFNFVKYIKKPHLEYKHNSYLVY